MASEDRSYVSRRRYRRCARPLALTAVLLLAAAATLSAHDLFLKLGSYFLAPHAEAEAWLMNGTFRESEAGVARDRMADVRVVGPAADDVARPPAAAWRDTASRSVLRFRTGAPGTYVLGVSTRPRPIELTGEQFDDYLAHDGILDVLERRRETGRAGTPAREIYAKHVKAVVQVGETRSEAWREPLGYPIEIVPLENPYRLAAGDTLPVRVLEEGEPVAGQLVYAAREGWKPPADAGPGEREPVRVRTDADGEARLPLREAGRWYARLIHMERTPEREDVDYVSKWATLTFEVAAGG